MSRRVGLLALAAAGFFALWHLGLGLRAPPLEVPSQGLVLTGVTVVRPGDGRDAARTLTVRGGRIEAAELRSAIPKRASIVSTISSTVVTSVRLPAKTSQPSGRPSRVTTSWITSPLRRTERSSRQ
jgi:hypothetical protein